MRSFLMVALTTAALANSVPSAHAQTRQTRENAFQWSGELASGQRLYLYNVNGRLTIESTSGSKLEVTARETWRRGNPADVSFEAKRVHAGRDVVVCALWARMHVGCDESGYESRRLQGSSSNDVQVEFTVKLPAGAHVTAHTVNGNVEISGISGDVDAETVNGNVHAESSAGAVEASTINGDIRVRMARIPVNGAKYETVNGSITLGLRDGFDAEIVATTVTGSVSSEFPITVRGSMSRHRLRGTIGRGGPRIEVSTVNGSVRITKS